MNRPSNPVGVTLKKLSRLEDAIFKHGGRFEARFMEIYSSNDEDEDLDTFLSRHGERWCFALKFCWETLKWRPSKRGKVFVKGLIT